MKSNNITNTTGRIKQAWKSMHNATIQDDTNDKIKKEVDKSKIHLGDLTKYYHFLDKAEVKINNKKVICKVLHRMNGSLIDFFTPEGELSFCDNLKEPCIIPRENLGCVVLDVNDNTHEWIMLGYYIKEDIIFNTPADAGYYKITNIGATNNYGLKIGDGEIKLTTSNGVSFNEGEFANETETIEYTTTDVYTKDEIDEIITNLRNELKGE